MDYKVWQDQDKGIVFATASGELDTQAEQSMVREILEMVNTTGSRKVLADFRELIFELPIFRIFERSQELRSQRQEYSVSSTKVAIVYASVNKKFEEGIQFFEDTSQNRGLPYRVFKDYELAMEWLIS